MLNWQNGLIMDCKVTEKALENFRVRTNEIKNVLAKKKRMEAGILTLIDDSGGTRDQQGK